MTKKVTTKEFIDLMFGPVAPIVIEAMEEGKKHREEIDHLLNYAVKNGYLDEDQVEKMTDKEKENYFHKCQNYEGGEY